MSEEIKSDDVTKLQKQTTEDIVVNPVNGNCNGPKEIQDSAGDAPAQEKTISTDQEMEEVQTETKMEEKSETKEDKSEIKEQAKQEDVSEGKQENKSEENAEDKSEELKDDKPEEKQKDKSQEKPEDKSEEKQEEISEEKEEDTSTTKDQKEKQSEENDDGDEDDDSEEELPPGLLERPVEIIKTKRERKKTSRFTYDDIPAASSDKKKFEISEGRGVKLSEHPRVEWQLQRNVIEDLKIIHKLFFGVFGDQNCKKNMRNFNGFPFEKDSLEFEKKEDYLGRFTLDNVKWALTVCDIESRKGKKEDLMDRLLEWCLCPKPSGKPIPEKKAKKEKPKKKKKKKAKKASEKKTKNDVSLTSDDVSDDESDSEMEEETPKKTKQTEKSPKKQTPKATPQSQKKRKATASPKRLAKVKIGSPKKSDEADSDDSEAPLNKKAKKPPTNAQVRKDVASILKGADLEVITMKAVCMKVYALYPDFDLSDKKGFIKETVKAIIS